MTGCDLETENDRLKDAMRAALALLLYRGEAPATEQPRLLIGVELQLRNGLGDDI